MSAAPRLVSARLINGQFEPHDMDFSRRRIPHFYPPGRWLFLAWHLHRSLPHGRDAPLERPPPGRPLSEWIASWIAPRGFFATNAASTRKTASTRVEAADGCVT